MSCRRWSAPTGVSAWLRSWWTRPAGPWLRTSMLNMSPFMFAKGAGHCWLAVFLSWCKNPESIYCLSITHLVNNQCWIWLFFPVSNDYKSSLSTAATEQLCTCTQTHSNSSKCLCTLYFSPSIFILLLLSYCDTTITALASDVLR